MRRQRPSLRVSAGRLQRRKRYASYMDSAAWQRRRAEWANRRAGNRIACAVCARQWNVRRDDLHHRTYDRLEAEADSDLVPLCRSCHDSVHQLMDTPLWARLPYRQRSDGVVAALAAQHSTKDTDHDR